MTNKTKECYIGVFKKLNIIIGVELNLKYVVCNLEPAITTALEDVYQ